MNTMDDYIPSDAEVVEGASRKRPAAILAAHFISVVLWVAFAMYDIHRNAAGNRAVPARVGANERAPSLDGARPVSYTHLTLPTKA